MKYQFLISLSKDHSGALVFDWLLSKAWIVLIHSSHFLNSLNNIKIYILVLSWYFKNFLTLSLSLLIWFLNGPFNLLNSLMENFLLVFELTIILIPNFSDVFSQSGFLIRNLLKGGCSCIESLSDSLELIF